MNATENIIELRDVCFGYEPGRRVLDSVNLTVNRGQSGCIVGPNGGGKSTLLGLLLGLLTPESGEIRIFGVSPVEARPKVGYMPQFHQLDGAFPVTALEVVLMGRLRRGFCGRYSAEDKRIARAALEEMGIPQVAGWFLP